MSEAAGCSEALAEELEAAQCLLGEAVSVTGSGDQFSVLCKLRPHTGVIAEARDELPEAQDQLLLVAADVRILLDAQTARAEIVSSLGAPVGLGWCEWAGRAGSGAAGRDPRAAGERASGLGARFCGQQPAAGSRAA